MKRLLSILFIGILSVGTMTAQEGWRYRDRDTRRDIRGDERDIRRDEAAIAHDREELRRDLRHHNYAAAERERAEIRSRYRDLDRDRADVRHDRRELRHDRWDRY